MHKWTDRLTPAVLALLAVAFTAQALHFKPVSALVPILIGITVLILSLIELATQFDGAAGRLLNRMFTPDKNIHAPAEMDPRRQLIAVGGLVGLVACMLVLGILPACAIFVALAMRFGADLSWRASVLSGLAMALVVWLVFGALLALDIPMGLLFDGGN